MGNHVFSENMKKFRLEKKLTQEEVADVLNVSTQAVSRWACGTTMPDIMLLPKIAELYGITIDSLYRKSSIAYDNYAQRLASVYEYTHSFEDFLRAELEFQKLMKSGELSTRDKFNYAYIFHEMLFDCKEKALEWYDKAIADGPIEDRHSYDRCRSLRARLLKAFGKGEELLAEQKASMSEYSDAAEWDYFIELYLNVHQYAEAYEAYQTAAIKYPECWKLYNGGAYACMGLKRYEEALNLFGKCGELGPAFHEDLVGMTYCYDEMGEYGKAISTEEKLYALYKSEGYEYEANICLDYIKELKEKRKRG